MITLRTSYIMLQIRSVSLIYDCPSLILLSLCSQMTCMCMRGYRHVQFKSLMTENIMWMVLLYRMEPYSQCPHVRWSNLTQSHPVQHFKQQFCYRLQKKKKKDSCTCFLIGAKKFRSIFAIQQKKIKIHHYFFFSQGTTKKNNVVLLFGKWMSIHHL